MELNAETGTNDVVRGLTTVTYGGTLTLSNLEGSIAPANRFKLFSAQTYRGVFSRLSPATPGAGLAWNTNTLATDGTLRIVSLAPAAVSSAASGNQFTLSWPDDRTGWSLQIQTNSSSIGANWIEIPGSTTTNEMTFAIDRGWAGAFFRLIYR